MEESSIYKALTIAVGLFIAIATITAVMSYYNTAKSMVQAIGTGTDYGEIYTDYVENILLKSEANSLVTGTEALNLVNYFYKNHKIQINVRKMFTLYNNDINDNLINSNLNLSNVNNIVDRYNELSSKIVPSQKFRITKSMSAGVLIIDLEGIK